jgi:hypothetical protein
MLYFLIDFTKRNPPLSMINYLQNNMLNASQDILIANMHEADLPPPEPPPFLANTMTAHLPHSHTRSLTPPPLNTATKRPPPNHPQTLIQPQWLLIPTFYVNNLIQTFPLSAYPDLNVYTYKPRPDLLLPIQAQKFNLFPVSIIIAHPSTTNANTRS